MSLVAAFLALTMVLVPIDDRPVTAQLPRLIGGIAGAQVVEPPPALLGKYLDPGQPDAILRWLSSGAPSDARAYVASIDMTAYGGLVASRIPGADVATAERRLDALAAVRAAHPPASFALFGTVMRLAPTGVPATGPAASFPFAGAVWPKIQEYANLPDPPQTDEQRALAARLRRELGPVLDAYLATRARNRDVDLYALRRTAAGAFDRVVIGQDDAGPVGLHLRDLAALRGFASSSLTPERAAIEPGTDELAMALVGAALVREANLVPRVRVVYSRPDGAAVQDPLEFAPISTTISELIRTCGGVEVAPSAAADVTLFVRVPQTSDADEAAFVEAIARDSRQAAIADLSFLAEHDYAEQRRLMNELIDRGVAARVAGFASWNTTANTVGTTLPEAFAALAGRRLGTYDDEKHRTFTLLRYLDDVVFQKSVRPQLNEDLSTWGISQHTYLTPDAAAVAASQNRALFWQDAVRVLNLVAPEIRPSRFDITLPWDRTFETELNLAPRS